MSWVGCNERTQEMIDDGIRRKQSVRVIPKREPIFICHSCDQIFGSMQDLNSHIKKAHNIIRPIITINNIISSSDSCFYEIENAKIYFYGFNKAIFINDVAVYDNGKEFTDITKLLKQEISGGSCTITVEDSPSFSVNLLREDNMDFTLIRKVMESWQNAVCQNKFIEKNYPDAINNFEKDFLDGLFNYYVGCMAERQNKASRYDLAFNLLNRFRNVSPLSRCILSIIAFRRNWIETLNELVSDSDSFDLANSFFMNIDSGTKAADENDEFFVYVENETKESLDAINAFMNKDYDKVREYVSRFGYVDMIEDNNLRDRVYLLKTKLAILDGNEKEARKNFENILSPGFLNIYSHLINEQH